MKCEKCGVNYPYNIYPLHIKRCNVEVAKEIEENEELIRQTAKELGIKSWHVKNIDKLKVEIEEL